MAIKTAPAQPESLWCDDNGMLVCAAHAGHALASAIAATPTVKLLFTSCGSWQKLTVREVASMAAIGLGCESCPTP